MGLRQDIFRDTVSDLHIRELITVKRGTTVRKTAALMRRKHLGCAIIVDDQHKPIGKFTERRLMRLLLDPASTLDDPVEKHSYTDASCVTLDTPVAEMARVMQAKQLRFMCVTDASGTAVGLTGQKGLMEYIAEHFPRQIKAQRMKPFLHMDHREGA